MDQWLDSLSEDWPSQPPSQHNSSSVLQDDSTSQSNGHQSRLPRRRGSDFSSLSSIKAKEFGRGPASQNRTASSALREISKSSLNAARRHLSENRVKVSSSDASQQRSKAHNHSASSTPSTPSTPSMPVGTVAYKASPTKEVGGTPEWKRRVVQGKVGQGDQTDMFGPIGLESVFKPPPTSIKSTKEEQGDLELQTSPEPEKWFKPLSGVPCPAKSGLVKNSGQSSTERDVAESDRKNGPAFSNSDERANGSSQNVGEHDCSQLPVNAFRSLSQSFPASITKPSESPLNDSRNDSDPNQSGSNSFSPFIVSKSHTMDGKVDYAAVGHGTKRPEDGNLARNTRETPMNGKENSALSFRRSQMSEITSQSLPEDLSVGTDAYAANGGFVSVRRGGYSNEGSFRERSLSPSPVKDVDGQSHQSKSSPNRHASPPMTPRKEDDDRPRSSGSPLKLFDKYDTFTNNRLARHISRFEETLAQNETPEAILEEEPQPSSPLPGPKVSMKLNRIERREKDPLNRRVRSFGSGELDDLDFSANANEYAEPSLPYFAQDASDQRHFPNHKRNRNVSRGNRHLKRPEQSVTLGISETDDTRILSEEDDALQHSQHPEISYTINGKRLPDSPKKKVARKRRKTLCSSEERKREVLDARRAHPASLVKETPTPAANGRKRKDARYDSEKQAADPKTLAMRQILRPRNPTPNQTGSSNRQKPLAKAKDHDSASKTESFIDVAHTATDSAAEVDPPTQIVAGALATIALNTVQEMETGSRKVSVTTSDFFNEAQQIMALIRAEKRPRSSHTSAETSNLGPSIIHEEPSTADSTKDDLTRPPSREGGSIRNLMLPTQRDARVVSHLRKFEDKDDLGLTLPSSGKSLKISLCDVASVASPTRLKQGDQLDDVESDPPNIRIRAALGDNEQEGHLVKSRDVDHGTDSAAQKADSHSSFGSSGRKTLPTGSSQGSANIKKIAPQSVAHLLSDQMADMFFDKQKQMWVKRKTSTGKGLGDCEVHAGSELTEEDLFGGIPDLSVDEMEELRMVKDVVSSENTLGSSGSKSSLHHQTVNSNAQTGGTASQKSNRDERPRTADGKVIQPADYSSAPSKHTNFAWSGPIPGTRATSYGDEVWEDKRSQDYQATLPNIPDHLSSPEVEHEISIFDGRSNTKPARSTKKHYQPRVVTVAFSSPLIQSPYQPYEDWDVIDQSELEESPSRHTPQLQVSTKRPNSNTSRHQRRVSHRLSIGNSSLLARPMSRLDEQDELSLIHYSAKKPQTSTDLAVMTPLPASRNWIVPPQSSIGFQLSPLPDFSVHQVDRPLDAEEHIDFDRCRSHGVSTALSVTAQEILRHLTDLEPFEPYWYYMQEVALQDRDLTSLHMLDEFCGQVQDLDVSKNRIRELGGVPSTVRSLIIRENCLSELTSWHSLPHLQYLDVSGNRVRSLQGFQNLIHLRSLTADNNQIESLDGIDCLDGLLSLRLRNNNLSSVSFERFNLKRILKLDLRGNKLNEVTQLGCLESLETLNLSMNSISDLCLDDPMPKLLSLDVADNQLNHIDITNAPNLRILNIDRNAVGEINGLRSHTRLETLSWREQRVVTFDDQMENCLEIRNLYLSRTCLSPAFNFKTSLLNLSTLEMASMGLQSLPDDFGLLCRNLRSLNLNYNAIHDIRPLLGISHLRTLYLAGNRLSRLRRTAAVIDRLSSELTELDMRNNTLTVGFYTPQSPSNIGTGERRLIVHNGASSILPGADDENDYIAESTKAHLLPPLDKDADTASRERLDEDTKLRRRVYEMLFVRACKSLQRLDGLDVDRGAVGRRDGVWERLVELDVLKPRIG